MHVIDILKENQGWPAMAIAWNGTKEKDKKSPLEEWSEKNNENLELIHVELTTFSHL